MNTAIRQTHDLLIKKHKTVAVAESCTGGLASSLLTEISGSSKYFTLGIVAYSNRSKQKLLGIPPGLIAKHGAVSKEVACLMAQNIRRLGNTDFGIGITGIAGPAGCAEAHTGASFSAGCGSLHKPVGTVFIAVEDRTKGVCLQFRFKGTRSAIRRRSALKALKILEAF
jgi:nicotinamide-nucleotide amidase